MFFAAVLKGIALGIVLSISVGPVIFSILKQSINNGHKGGFAFIAGVSASDIGLVLVCNIFTKLFHSLLSHREIIGITGSGFLILMGVFNIFFKKIAVADDGSVSLKKFTKGHLIGVFVSGFFMNLLNPGVFLFWFASTASIIDNSNDEIHPIQYRIVVFATCLLFVLAGDIAKVFGANSIRGKLTPHNIHIINRISGLILIGFGIALGWGMIFYAKHH